MEEGKIKVLFPDDIETITISKNDYDRLYGEMTLENIELKEEIERLKERLSFYESDDDIVLMSKEKWEEIKQELQIEKATNKELLSTGADLENKLYEEQDKNKRLNNIINELKIILRQKGIEITIYDQPNYEKISGYVSITMTPEQLKKELEGER